MSEGFKGFVNKEEDDEFNLNINVDKVGKIIKEYKRLKKLQRSGLYQAAKLSGKKTKVDKLIDKYGIDSEAIE